MGLVTTMRRGRVALEVNVIPAGFGRSLERRLLARNVVVTDTGIEFEPIADVDEVVDACRRAGLRVWSVTRPCGRPAGWERTARPARGVHRRLGNARSPVWLPTYPAT